MVDLAMKSKHRPVALVDILDDQDISLSYLEQLFGRLKEKNLVVGIRGPKGGYRLGLAADAITVGQIVDAVEDYSYRGRKSRITGEQSDAHLVWNMLSGDIQQFLQGLSLTSLMDSAGLTASQSLSGKFSRPAVMDRHAA